MAAARPPVLAAVSVDLDRLRTLAKFIHNQAHLTDEKSPQPGPGEVKLNHEEAALCASALHEHIRHVETHDHPRWNYSALADFYRRHGFIGKAAPLCLLCRGPSSWPPPLQHPELPNIIVCNRCLEG